jgi:D-alanyl-D-alanine carboxypeptidase/glycopeptide antibiotics resistance protein
MINYLLDTSGYVITGLFTCILYIVCYSILLKIRKKQISWLCTITMALLGIYLSIVFSVTVSPVYGYSRSLHLDNVNLIPGKVLQNVASNSLNFLGNLFMFVPLGTLVPMMSRSYRKLIPIARLGALLSLLIEILQLFLNRGTDVDDIILNTLGTVVGYFIFVSLYHLFPILKTNKKKVIRYRKPVIVLVLVMLCSVIITGGIKRNELLAYNTQEDTVTESCSSKVSKEKSVNQQNNEEERADKDLKDKKELQEDKAQQDKAQQGKEEQRFANLNLEARNICLVDVSKNKVLFSKESDEEIAPASTTKMLTALTALKFCDEDEKVEVGNEINLIAPDASRAGLVVGNRLTIKQLLEGLLLPSGNDAAYVLAVYTGRKIGDDKSLSESEAISVFVEEMNKKAVKIGATHSNFIKPDGYDSEGQYSTASDLVCIATAFMKSKAGDGLLSNIVNKDKIRECFADNTDVTWENTNELINPDSNFYYKNAVGLKTGSSTAAGKCLISAVYKDDELYIAVVMGDTEEGRFQDSIALYDALNN